MRGHDKKMIGSQKLRRSFSFTALVLITLLLSGCVYQVNEPVKTESVPKVSPTADEEGYFAAREDIACIPNLSRYETATLIDVVDGDSIKVIVDGQPVQVRYIGINTPEYDSPQRDAAIEATQVNRRLLSGGRPLYLFKDITNTDKYGRLLRYVVANGKFINLELVRLGQAESKWYRPDISCQLLFDRAAAEQ